MFELKEIASTAVSGCKKLVEFSLGEYSEFEFSIHFRGGRELRVLQDMIESLRMMFEDVPSLKKIACNRNYSFSLDVPAILDFNAVRRATNDIVGTANSKVESIRNEADRPVFVDTQYIW